MDIEAKDDINARPRLRSNFCTILFLESMLKKGINHIVLKIYIEEINRRSPFLK